MNIRCSECECGRDVTLIGKEGDEELMDKEEAKKIEEQIKRASDIAECQRIIWRRYNKIPKGQLQIIVREFFEKLNTLNKIYEENGEN